MTIETLLDTLLSALSDESYDLLREYSAGALGRHRRPVAALGIKSAAARPAAFGGYAGQDAEGNERRCRRLELIFSLDIFSSEGGSESECRKVFSAFAEKLADLPAEFISPSLETGEIRAEGRQLLLPATLSAAVMLYDGTEDAPYLLDFDMKGKLTI